MSDDILGTRNETLQSNQVIRYIHPHTSLGKLSSADVLTHAHTWLMTVTIFVKKLTKPRVKNEAKKRLDLLGLKELYAFGRGFVSRFGLAVRR